MVHALDDNMMPSFRLIIDSMAIVEGKNNAISSINYLFYHEAATLATPIFLQLLATYYKKNSTHNNAGSTQDIGP